MRDSLPYRVSLGAFDVDLRAGELRRGSTVTLLREQSLQILRMLIAAGGEIVTREEIQKRLWPNDTVVEFNHSINTAIKNLRRAFGDSADEPRYVETVARRGYRLLMPVENALDDITDLTAEATSGGAVASPRAAQLIGKNVSHYRVLAVIGGGGMGMVYRAEDLKLGRQVALKFLPDEMAMDSVALKRFEREARTASSLDHPNICTIYSVEEHGEQPFIVMQLLQGETLRERLANLASEERTFVIDDLLGIAVQICDGLRAAHEKKIIHRDMKPANIFLTEGGQAKILDFGLAKLVDPQENWNDAGELSANAARGENSKPVVDRTLTGLGVAMGTTGYMSPEQVRGEQLDERTDIFSFGLVLYEMATGQRAFSGETAAVVHNAILHQSPVPADQISSAVPASLAKVIEKALEKQRRLRYSTIAELRSDLMQVIESRSSKELEGRPARHRQQVDSMAVLPFENATGDANLEYVSEGVTENLIGLLSEVPRLRVTARSTVYRYQNKTSDPQAVGRALNVNAVLTGRVLQRGDALVFATELVDVTSGWRIWGQQYSRKLEEMPGLEEEIARKISEKLRPHEEKRRVKRRQARDSHAYQEYLRGRYYWNQRTASGATKAIESFERAVQADPQYALAYVGMADAYNILGFYGFLRPHEAFPKAKAAALRAIEIDHTVVEARASLAYVRLFYEWDWELAEKELKGVVKASPNYASGRQFYAHYLAIMGRFDESLAELERALELDPLSFIINAAIGWTRYFSRRYEESIDQLRKTLEIDPHFVLAHALLGQAYLQNGRTAEAIGEMRAAYESSGQNAYYQGILAHGLAVSGARREAENLIDDLHARSSTSYVSAYSIAEGYIGLGDRDEAFRWLEKAYEERSRPLILLNIEPKIDPLRSDPRLESLLRRLKFAGVPER